ncbi:MAG: hypothetical protein IKN89_03760 [Oscillospiraceae bacterium]|nr:hypothetical protein [Oscillospiraceae bacterium]
MNAKKNMMRTLAVAAIVLVLFCVLAFAIPFVHGAVFWLAFIFTIIAILAQLYIAKKAFANGEGARSKFYGFPIARVGFIYLVVQVLAGLVCMALGLVLPVWVAVVLFILILALAAIGFITVDAIRDEVERQDAVLKTNVTSMRTLQSKAAAIAAQCEDASLKSTLNAMSDKFRFSDPVSSAATEEAETGLAALMEELQTAVLDSDSEAASALAKRLEAALAERNRLCKLGK